MLGGTVGSKAIALGLKKVNPALFTQMSKAVDDGVDADGLVGMFAGKRAKGFDDAVKFSDVADKQERFWIDDIGARMKPLDKNIVSHRLEDVMDHPTLFKEYPELKDIRVSKGRSTYYSPELNHIKIAKYREITDDISAKEDAIYKGVEKLEAEGKLTPAIEKKIDKELRDLEISSRKGLGFDKSDLLHEVQHAIQKKEGFSKGGSVDSIEEDALIKEIYKKYKDLPYVKDLVDGVKNRTLTHS